MQMVTEDNITELAVAALGNRPRPAAGRDHDRSRAAPARLRPRGAAHRGRVDGRHPVADAHRADQRRQAPGVHPRLRRARPVDARRADEPPLRRPGHARHGARPVPHRRLARARLRRGHGRRRRRATRSTSTAWCATSTASRCRAPCSTCGRPTATARTRPSSTSTRPRLRGKYASRDDGTYCVRTIAPKGYTIPMDGPVGDLIGRTDISHFRPAHVHFLVDGPGLRAAHHPPVRAGRRYLDSDVVFGTKEQLVVPFERHEPATAPDGVVVGAVDRRGLRLRAAAQDIGRA